MCGYRCVCSLYLFLFLLFPLSNRGQHAQVVLFSTTSSVFELADTFNRAPAVRYYTSFVEEAGLIWVWATIDGTSGWCLLDTGAPGLIVHRPLNGALALPLQASGMAGEPQAAMPVEINSLRWGPIELNDISAWQTDLSRLTALLNRSVLGVLGMEVLDQLRLTIDYGTEILLMESATTGAGPLFAIPGARQIACLPFEWAGHVPVIELVVKGHSLRLGIDTGASVNLLDSGWLRKRRDVVLPTKDVPRNVQLQFLGQADGQVYPQQDLRLEVETKKVEVVFVLMPFRRRARRMDLDLDGLLGYPFLKNYRVVLDFQHNRLELWQ